MKIKIFFLAFSMTAIANAQLPETDIFISSVTRKNGKIEFSRPENVTNRLGYDNQPYFMPDGSSLLYVAVPDTTQADIFSYDFQTKRSTAITSSPESEYSPTLSLDGRFISVVRVDGDGGQRFYNLPKNKTASALHIPGTDSIGYYCWLNDSSLAMFILGNAMTLQVLNINTGLRTLIASDIGRCMKLSNDKKSLFFVIKQNKSDWGVFEMNIGTGVKRRIVSTIAGSEDFAIMPDGLFLMGNKGKLFTFNPAKETGWSEIADFSSVLSDFYRISVNTKGDRIAMVAFTGEKP